MGKRQGTVPAISGIMRRIIEGDAKGAVDGNSPRDFRNHEAGMDLLTNLIHRKEQSPRFQES